MEEKVSLKDSFVGIGQKLGKAIMMPISILPVAGLFLGIAAALSSGAVIKAYSVLDNSFLQGLFKLMNAVGNEVFGALPLIFAVGIAAGLAKAEKGSAGLSAVVGYFVLLTGTGAFMSILGKEAPAGADIRLYGQAMQFGIKTLNMNVFGGVLAGIVTGVVHNKYYKTKLPDVLAFFGGARFVPIVNTVVFMGISLVMVFIWPAVANMISYFGTITEGLGLVGAFIYGLILRSFYVIGLHHVFYLPFWTTAAGGTLEIGGKVIEGWQTIFLAQLADPNTTHYFSNIALYNSGRYFHMLFTMPAVCLAMYRAIPAGPKRKATFGFLFSIALTAFITGVTEPISFALLFASPLLFVAEAISFAISFVIAAMAKVTIGSTFSAGLVEFLLFGVFQGNAKTNWIWIVIWGIPIFIANYFLFKLLIEKLNAKTPGRESDEEAEKKLSNKYQAGQAKTIVEALGGLDNIDDLDNCATRLRVTVKKLDKVNIELLKQTGAHNVVTRGKNLQVIYGPTVNLIRTEIDEYISTL